MEELQRPGVQFPLPWQAAEWEVLHARGAAGRLPHALLLCGSRGLGKRHFAVALAHFLLCEQPTDGVRPCTRCRGCGLTAAGSHPDLLVVEPEEKGKALRVDQIRELCEKLSLKSGQGGYKVAIIAPAERMNASAANSLLKTLEEPAGNALLLLVTDQPSSLPATIRSRCQKLTFREPQRAVALRWLAERGIGDGDRLLDVAGGAPLEACAIAAGGWLEQRLALFEDFEQVTLGQLDPVDCAQRWSKLDTKEVLRTLAGWLTDMIRLRAAQSPPRIGNRDLSLRLHALAEPVHLYRLHRQLEHVLTASRQLDGQLNVQLLLEDLLLGWTDRGTGPAHTLGS
jgi:DNA polymerase III subunit delta'